ncbi:hypothetical protein SAMN06295912_11719 [Sphingomonas laterariae]|uniref:Uncharacterized protein n=1 Tax=Edaphosphingomonas laterariae TaxID=861865 RepID=A0A239HGW7_9SPHN|nr:hypothetical protein [Sphingomonas laterariae]SNS80607.1 hypothetical protein SAMN06295912_11719 [Sphingomonas laterariae]
MKRIIVGIALACASVPAAASEAVTMQFACSAPDMAAAKPVQPGDLAGLWDALMDVGGIPSFGLLSLGMMGPELGGSLALTPGVVVVRSLKVDGRMVAMVVASNEGDVRFNGALAGDGKRMCGIVDYHGGQKVEMIMQKRPERRSATQGGRAG